MPLLALPKGGWAEHGLLLEYGEAGSVEGVRVRAWERRHARVQTVAPEQARSGTRICVSRCPRCRVGPRQPSLRLCGSECGSDPIGECGQDRLVCKSGTPARNGLVCACGCEHAHVLTRVCVHVRDMCISVCEGAPACSGMHTRGCGKARPCAYVCLCMPGRVCVARECVCDGVRRHAHTCVCECGEGGLRVCACVTACGEGASVHTCMHVCVHA